MIPTPWSLIALAALGLTGWAVTRSRQRRRIDNKSLNKTRALQTWEGEGGGLPNGGPQVTLGEPTAPSSESPR